MKLFRNSACYVDFKSLARYEMPDYLVFDKNAYEENDYVMFTDQKSIDYVKNRCDIIDYGEVSTLDDGSLNMKITEIYQKLEPYVLILIEMPLEKRKKLFENKDFVSNYELYFYLYYELVEYKQKRDQIDEEIQNLIFKKDQKIR